MADIAQERLSSHSDRRQVSTPAIVVRVVANEALVEAARLAQAVFGFSDTDSVPAWEMHVASRHGAVALGAYRDEALVAFSYAFPAWRDNRAYLYSNGLAVRRDVRCQGVGYRLKEAQRHFALQRGFDTIVWTANPLAAAALRLYLTKLGARIVAFLPSFVEDLLDGQALDEVEIEWRIRERERPSQAHFAPTTEQIVVRAPAGPGRQARAQVLPRSVLHACADVAYLIEVPVAWQLLRSRDPQGLATWRREVARVIPELLARGYVGTDVVIGTGAGPFLRFTKSLEHAR